MHYINYIKNRCLVESIFECIRFFPPINNKISQDQRTEFTFYSQFIYSSSSRQSKWCYPPPRLHNLNLDMSPPMRGNFVGDSSTSTNTNNTPGWLIPEASHTQAFVSRKLPSFFYPSKCDIVHWGARRGRRLCNLAYRFRFPFTQPINSNFIH